ncbi:MAG: hypothetical protein Q9209_006046 [Squamulea sp. 1 TL-2023]
MANLKDRLDGLYWILPLVSAATWLGMLLAMFIVWEVQGTPHYVSMEANQRIAYISDIGAQELQPLFITGACVTTIFLDLSFFAERWLRHRGRRLAKNLGVAEKASSALSIFFAVAGTCGLILLSVFDTVSHPRLHDGFLLIFIAGYIISAIFICAEYQRLGVHYRNLRVLRRSFWMKLFFIIIEVLLAAVFIGTSFTSHKSIGAVFEWVIALIFTCYVLTFFVDLWPARTNGQWTSNMEMGHMDRATVEYRNGNAIGTGQQPKPPIGNVDAATVGHIDGTVVHGRQGYDGAGNGLQPKPPIAQNY